MFTCTDVASQPLGGGTNPMADTLQNNVTTGSYAASSTTPAATSMAATQRK